MRHGVRQQRARPTAASAAQAETAGQQQESALQSFLRWLIANGVEGVGTAGSKIALYEGEGGERGVVSLHPIAAGEVVMNIPLRLAITDAVDEDDGSGAPDADVWELAAAEAEQPWSVRLAGRLLSMLAEGHSGRGSVANAEAGQARATAASEAAAALLQCQLDKEEEGDLDFPDEAHEAGSMGTAQLNVAELAAGSASPWQPYLQVLPRTVPSPLTTFSWEDIQAIEYQPMRDALDHATWLASSAGQLPGGNRFSREQWEWALSVVHSRTFGAPGRSGGVGVRMLVPLIDMLNHAGDYLTSPAGASEPTAQAFDNVRWELRAPTGPEGEWRMEVAATRDIPAGEELLLSYGERSNDDFFLHYGFVPPRNPHDDVALFSDIEACIDWWLDRYLPPGALPPSHLQAVINFAYAAAEEQDGAAGAAAAVLDAVPEAEADVIRAELAKIKLSAGGMVDGRLLAAYRTLYEAAAQRGEQTQHQQAALGASWPEHLRRAVAARSLDILRSMPTPLPQDLHRLTEWERQSGAAPHAWAAAQRHYSAAVEAYEAAHGSVHSGQDTASSVASQAGDSSSDGAAVPLLDASADAALAQLLLQQAKAAAGDSDAGSSEGSADSSTSILPIIFRTYKKLVLWDAVLLQQ